MLGQKTISGTDVSKKYSLFGRPPAGPPVGRTVKLSALTHTRTTTRTVVLRFLALIEIIRKKPNLMTIMTINIYRNLKVDVIKILVGICLISRKWVIIFLDREVICSQEPLLIQQITDRYIRH